MLCALESTAVTAVGCAGLSVKAKVVEVPTKDAPGIATLMVSEVSSLAAAPPPPPHWLPLMTLTDGVAGELDVAVPFCKGRERRWRDHCVDLRTRSATWCADRLSIFIVDPRRRCGGCACGGRDGERERSAARPSSPDGKDDAVTSASASCPFVHTSVVSHVVMSFDSSLADIVLERSVVEFSCMW